MSPPARPLAPRVQRSDTKDKVAESASPEAAKIRTEAIPLADFSRLKLVVVLQWTFSAEEEEPPVQVPPEEDSEPESGGE